MENTSNTPIRDRDIFYYRQRYKNRVFSELVSFFAEEAERLGITKRDIAARLKRDPALISRWLSAPSNLTLETISDLLLALGAEMDSRVTRFSERHAPNFAHPLIERVLGLETPQPTGRSAPTEESTDDDANDAAERSAAAGLGFAQKSARQLMRIRYNRVDAFGAADKPDEAAEPDEGQFARRGLSRQLEGAR